MQYVKKYFTEGLIQFTILLSLVGVRVDVDTYLNGYFSPLLETDEGPSSAYIQTPFHSSRDTWEGHSLHPKCPDLEQYFTARRLLTEVRALGTPRFPTQLSAWLVHSVSRDSDSGAAGAAPDPQSGGSGGPDRGDSAGPPPSPACELAEEFEVNKTPEALCGASAAMLGGRLAAWCPVCVQESRAGWQPGVQSWSCSCSLGFESHRLSLPLPHAHSAKPVGQIEDGELQRQDAGQSPEPAAGEEGEAEERAAAPELQGAPQEALAHSSTLDREVQQAGVPSASLLGRADAKRRNVLSSASSLSTLAQQPLLAAGVEHPWRELLSLSNLEDMEIEDPQQIPDAISRNVSLHDAMLSGDRDGRASWTGPGGSLEPAHATHPALLGALNLTAELFPLVENSSRDGAALSSLSGFLDEAVFEQINLMGLGLDGLGGLDSRILDELDSDSGLSLDSSFRSPGSPSASEASSLSHCEDEGAVGYSTDSDSLSGDAAAGASWSLKERRPQGTGRSPAQLAQGVLHDHTYSSPPPQRGSGPRGQQAGRGPLGAVKKEGGEEDELSRDERRARALDLPLSVQDIVNMPVEEFLELLSGFQLSDAQVALIRDIRRRGKNKVAAQNCRRRKLDAIAGLEGEVERLRRHRDRLLRDRAQHSKSLGCLKQRLGQLYRDVFRRLRDEQGRPVSPGRYALQCHSDGSVLLVPHRPGAQRRRPDRARKDKQH
uniref:Nfe2 like bZIP transcription factor 3 n=1 Tax=Lepisosteus oculatus TaxID=7918 RepID=W5N1B4_LEPOC